MGNCCTNGNTSKSDNDSHGNVTKSYEDLNRAKTYEVDIVLDRESAHPNLVISEDGKSVWWSSEISPITMLSEHFDEQPYVLGQIGRARRAYWEVKVEGKHDWVLGVAKKMANRKGQLELIPTRGFWAIRLSNGRRLKVISEKENELKESVIDTDIPGIVGIFLDYIEKKVTFYNVTNTSVIYEFQNGPEYNDEVRPLFSPWNNDTIPFTVLSIEST